MSEVDGNREKLLSLLTTNAFTIAKSCVRLFSIVFFPESGTKVNGSKDIMVLLRFRFWDFD